MPVRKSKRFGVASEIPESADLLWPYASTQLLEAREIKTIGGQARAVLSKALTSGRTLAFVGSGVSNCYGRMTWAEMVAMLDAEAKKAGRTLQPGNGRPWHENPRISGLWQTLESIKFNPNDASSSALLVDAADHAINIIDRIAELGSLSVEPQTSKAREMIKRSLIDDAGHMRRLLKNLQVTVDQEEKLDGLTARQLRSYFSVDVLRKLIDGAPASGPVRRFEFVLKHYAQGVGQPLQVRHRFLVPLVAMLAEDWEGSQRPMDRLESALQGAPETTRPPRSHFVAPERDPLLLMYDLLGLRRFFTTNWDQEIERLFDDKGLARRGDAVPLDNEPGDDDAKRLVGNGDSTVLVYDQTKATRLAAFASQDKLTGPGVAYLHGRATPKDSIVVTGNDYRSLYLKRSDFLSMSQAALKLTFGGNPVLFVGLGMEEEDVLRPLREFMSGSEGIDNRPIVAILPATHEISRVKAQASRLLNDCGVLTIHYGHDAAGLGDAETWLHQRHAEIRKVESALIGRQPVETPTITAPRSLDGLSVRENPTFDLSEECQLLNELMRVVKASAARVGPQTLVESSVLLSCLRELKYQLQSGFLCATLQRIADHRDNWHDNWLDTEANWEPEPSRARENGPEDGVPVYAFGATYLKSGAPDEDNIELRFDWGAPSQTFNGLVDALEAHRKSMESISGGVATQHRGRRVLLLVGSRGVGRGHFFASMRSKERMAKLQAALCGVQDPQPWAVQVFLSIGQRVDIAAARHNFMAGLEDFLRRRGDLGPQVKLSSVINDRLGDLLSIAAHSDKAGRMVVVFNSLDLWFDPSGRGKNGVIDEFLVQIFGKQSRSLPMDVIVVAGARTLPHIFGTVAKVESNKPFKKRSLMAEYDEFRPWEVRKPGLSLADHRALDRRRTALGVDSFYATSARQPTTGLSSFGQPVMSGAEEYGNENYFHILRPARASIVLSAFMPELTGAYIAAILQHAGLAKVMPAPGGSAVPLAQLTGLDQTSIAPLLMDSSDGHRTGKDIIRKYVEHLMARRIIRAAPADIDQMVELVDGKFKGLFEMVERQRYALSLLGACADEIVKGTCPDDPYEETLRKLYEFVERFRRDLETIDRRDREATVIRLCLDEFRRRHERGGEPLPLPMDAKLAELIQKDNPLFNLQHTLLWHLAAFGQAVRFDIILDSPEIQRAARRAFRKPPSESDVIKLIGYAIRLLVHRCLVLPLDRRGEPKFENRRYGTHRSMQLYVLRWLGSPPFEFQEVNQFTVTSYLNQPKDMPRLKRRTHVDLRRTISAFIGFPDIDGELAKDADRRVRSSVTPDRGDDAVRDANRERASTAISTMRSVYSVASIARLGSLEGDLIETQDGSGLFTEHNRQVRWLLLKNSVSKDGLLSIDDIVWALNECGVMSHIRGHLSDANVLFDVAERAACRIESHPNAPLRSRIFLNRAIVMIEQGRGKDVGPRLDAIANNARENKIIRQLATGMGALIDHLAGRTEIAEAVYTKTVELLEEWDRPRSASFFSRHLGNLLNSRRTESAMIEARRRLEASITMAEEGGHQDVMHEALAALAGLQINQGEARSSDVLAHLLTAENYARRVGMSRLVLEVHLHRGRFHMMGGDLTRAVEEFSEALRLAVGNRHKLRVISALTYLAEALSKTSARSGCGALLDLATTMAQSTDYFTGLARAQRLRMAI